VSDPKRGRLSGLWVLIVFPILGILAAVLTLTGLPGSLQNGKQAAPSGVTIGAPAPDFKAATLDDQSVRLSDLKGSIVAVTFWATWCEPCKTELPEWQKAVERDSGKQLVVLAVNAGEEAGAARAFLKQLNLNLPVVLDPDSAIQGKYGVRVLPVTFWVDAQGVLQGENLGAVDLKLIERTMATLK